MNIFINLCFALLSYINLLVFFI